MMIRGLRELEVHTELELDFATPPGLTDQLHECACVQTWYAWHVVRYHGDDRLLVSYRLRKDSLVLCRGRLESVRYNVD